MGSGGGLPPSAPKTTPPSPFCDGWGSGRSAGTGMKRTARSSSSSWSCSWNSASAPERALDVALRVPLGDVPPFVTLLLASSDREFELGAPVLEVEPGWDERQPLLLHLPDQ